MSSEWIKKLVRPAIVSLEAYSSARSLMTLSSSSTYLDANENPQGPKKYPTVNRYPDPQPKKLLEKFEALYGAKEENILIGRGVDDVLDVLIRTFCEAGVDEVVICPPTYGAYEVFANIQGAKVRRVPLTKEFQLDVESIIKAWTPSQKLIFVCSPNNPTGNTMNRDDIVSLCRYFDQKALVVLDEAYIEFASVKSMAVDISEFSNLVVLRTLSKAWGLAGARCGVAIANEDVISFCQKVRAPYPLTQPSVDVCLEVLGEKNNIGEILEERKRLMDELKKISIVTKIYPTEANFCLVEVADSRVVMNLLKDNGVIARDRSSQIPNTLRITVGTKAENNKLLAILKNESVA